MEREYQTEEVRAVWEALRKAYSEKRTGCTARDIASATGLSEEVVRACLEYLKQEGKVERAGEIYVPASEATEVKSGVAMAARRYGAQWPAAMPEREMRFAQQAAGSRSLPTREVLGYLSRAPEPKTAAEIAVALGLNVDDVREALVMLKNRGKVEECLNGKWRETSA
jgi:predicted ArsR family transcriptional regulator